MMAWPTIACGLALILVGVVGYGTAEPNADTGKVSPTALIPAVIGAVLVVGGVLAFNNVRRKHVMHLAAVVGVIGFVGGFMPLVTQYRKTGEVDPLKPSAVSGELMIVICAVFVWLCVNSFIAARRARKMNHGEDMLG